MKTTPDPDPLPTGLGPRVAPVQKPAPATPRSWRPLSGHRDYESDGRAVRKIVSPHVP